MLQTLVHYSLHLVAPLLLAWIFFPRERRRMAYIVMLLTMLVDLDHLLATPIFDPDRCSIGFHFLHSYYLIPFYILMCFLPYRRLGLPWWLSAVGIGLTFHMFTDWQDYYLW
ncbi:DUF6122 family protein [Porphyromonas sp. COT-290 OH3588]|uniref:DUF6122 family protein n=1 Tax=Porphyromonas sp. COT-290 OH3588 TaxID=1515617 RepID=UPI00052D1210|nr:DUF6122 family protein [Porphyromonas sp. COT-290 OH3588]KGO00862.1 membrane protein [Porphyromonas sp. COT-290 OH3588]